jgi:hypothetical protein
LGLVGEAGRWSYRFRMRHCEFYAAMRAINPAPGVFLFRLQFLTAGRTKKPKFHLLKMLPCVKEIKKLMA